MNMDAVRVLVIDDEQGIRDLLTYELGSRGYKIVSADCGEQGLERLREQEFSLVISDIKMPGIDGLTVLREVKAMRPETQVILLTGFGTMETAVDAMKHGAYDFVQKPFIIDELAALVEKALEKKELSALVALHEASRAVFRTLDIDELIPQMEEIACKVLRTEQAAIFLIEDGKLAAGAAGRPLLRAMAEKLLPEILAQKNCLIPEAVGKDVRLAGVDGVQELQGVFMAPLMGADGVIGALIAVKTSTGGALGVEQKHADIFSSQVSQALSNAMAYRRLKEAQEKLVHSERLGAAGLLAAGVAHDLNSPLTGILGLAQVIKDQPNMTSEQREDMTCIIEQAHRCSILSRGLLGLSRDSAPRTESVPLMRQFEMVLRLLRKELGDKQVEVVREIPGDLPDIQVDPLQIQQVFLNLCVNAGHAMEGRPVKKLQIRAELQGSEVLVHVRDSGHGIPKDKLPRIFEPFYTTKAPGKGTGLGLYICQNIVSRHGGRLEVDSQEGEWTEFTVRLPVAPKHAAENVEKKS
ncbi:MAG: response regulator [Elusimicrobiota bacterium]|jgi:signal transduction histidine kinase/DNA-binding response OmpR family regulator